MLAADKGDSISQQNLGAAYWLGEGVPKNYDKAITYWQMAADQGEVESQYRIGLAYQDNKSVSKNDLEAYKWFLLASANGHKKANEEIPLLETKLSPQQITAGRRFAAEWKPIDIRKKVSNEGRVGGEIANRADNVGFLKPLGSGSGFFISSNGHFITANHVLENAR